MRVEQLKLMLRKQPFEPFTIHLPEGRTVKVWHHDFAMLSPDGRTLVVFDKDGIGDWIDVMLIASIRMDQPDKSSDSALQQAFSN
jgi:hypothetical protein